ALDVSPILFADPALVEVTPDGRDVLETYRRIVADPTRKTSVHRIMATIEMGREAAPSC
ncbi:hypothetical protein G3T14_20860, partial [Methylobacterium sp. BTF04]|nr:hypothetical protein [Methylobacterium sp. BTF04]